MGQQGLVNQKQSAAHWAEFRRFLNDSSAPEQEVLSPVNLTSVSFRNEILSRSQAMHNKDDKTRTSDWVVYLLLSAERHLTYVGSTNNLEQR